MKCAALLLAAAMLTNCGSHTTVPQTSNSIAQSHAKTQAINNSNNNDEFADGIPDLFAAAQNKNIGNNDIDSYIDKSVVGADRALAHKFMSMMPRNMRGDFVYVDQHDHLVTNNPRLLPYIRIRHVSPPQTSAATVATASRARHVMGGFQSSCAPPNPPGSPQGPYVRQVSQCGFTTGWTFLHLQCGTTSLNAGDYGYMYMELMGAGRPYYSLSEGGLFVPSPGNDHNINPYVRTSAFQQMQNGAARYDCANDLGIVSGATQDGRYIYTATGELPSTCVPESKFCNGARFTFNKQAWLFANAPSDITGPGYDAIGVRTPCVTCSISRVTTIAQGVPTYTENGDIFASDANGGVYLHYMQTAFGEWESNCEPGTSLCTFDYSIHPTRYYAGYQYYPNESDATSVINPSLGATYGPWESYDGISMTCCSSSKAALHAAGAFTLTLPTYTWRQRGYKNPGVERVTNWEVTTDNGATWDTYCTASHTTDYAPVTDLGGEDCDGNENTDNPSIPYPGGVAI